MNWLLDVNLILASRWTTHANHSDAKAWIDSVDAFHTCAIGELGFVRIQSSAAEGLRKEANELIAIFVTMSRNAKKRLNDDR